MTVELMLINQVKLDIAYITTLLERKDNNLKFANEDKEEITNSQILNNIEKSIKTLGTISKNLKEVI